MKEKIKKFWSNEDGSELLQWAIIIIIALGLAAVAYTIYESLTDQLHDAKDQLDAFGTGSHP